MKNPISLKWHEPGNELAAQQFQKDAAALFLTILLGLFNTLFSEPAYAADPDHVSFTLEGCRTPAPGYNPDTTPPDLVCDDSGYTTGNLGKGWNELDLVPHRLTADAGQPAPASQTYKVAIAADNEDGSPARPGYDHILQVVLNTAKSDASCQLVVGPEKIMSPGLGGISKTIYRELTITQAKNKTCVIDWVERLAVGSHLFPGSSLHSNAGLVVDSTHITTSGIGARDVSIPVKEILPQILEKDMSATQNASHTWNLTKGPTPASLHFGDVCTKEGNGPFDEPVTITVTWTKLQAELGGNITVITHVYATNPSARIVTTNVTDTIYSGTTQVTPISGNNPKNSGDVDVPANTADFVVLTNTITVPPGTANLNDIAIATYKDKIFPDVSIPGTTQATASATIDTGTTLNGSATITDNEWIVGTGLTFAVASPSLGALDIDGTSYTAGTFITGVPDPLHWVSGLQNTSGFVDFEKTVRLASKQVTSGTLYDTATLNGSDGFGPINASASVAIDSTATVTLNVVKTIPDTLETGEKIEVDIRVTGPNGIDVTKTFSFGAGDTSKSAFVTGAPGTYNANETRCEFFAAGSSTAAPCGLLPDNPSKSTTITLPTCDATLTFNNRLGEDERARIQVKKDTIPVTDEADPWLFTLSCTNGVGNEGPIEVDANTGYVLFAKVIEVDTTCMVTETLKDGWMLDSVSPTLDDKVCTLVIDLPENGGVKSCNFTNKKLGKAKVEKTVSGGAIGEGQFFTFELRKDASTVSDGTILETKDATFANSGAFAFTTQLVPGQTYQICEQVFPGWSTNLSGDSALFVPNSIIPPSLPNPNVDNLTVCTNFSVSVGQERTFTVDNTPPPGGRALTIGFWKNWTSCDGKGSQDPVLDETLALFPIASGQATHGVFIGDLYVDTCWEAVSLLDKRVISVNLNGKKMASDAAWNNAAQLLAYRLNIQAGAGTCPDAVNAATWSQALLDAKNFNGLTHNTLSKTDSSDLNTWAGILDKYNNNNLCI